MKPINITESGKFSKVNVTVNMYTRNDNDSFQYHSSGEGLTEIQFKNIIMKVNPIFDDDTELYHLSSHDKERVSEFIISQQQIRARVGARGRRSTGRNATRTESINENMGLVRIAVEPQTDGNLEGLRRSIRPRILQLWTSS